MLKSAYKLPFAVTHPSKAFLSTGQGVALMLRLREGIGLEDAARVAGVMALFVRFANTGGLAGENIEPWRSGLIAHPATSVRPNELSFRWESCLIDDASLVVLSTMFLRKELAPLVQSLEVRAAGAHQSLSCDPASYSSYPQRFARMPFQIIDEEPETGAYTLTLDLDRPLEEKNRPVLTESLDAWTAFILAGGFALAPIPPDDTYVEPDDPFVDFDSTVEWSVFKLSADSAALDALLNVISAFHARQQRLQSLTIS